MCLLEKANTTGLERGLCGKKTLYLTPKSISFTANKTYTSANLNNNNMSEETFMAELPKHAKVVVIGQGGIVGASFVVGVLV